MKTITSCLSLFVSVMLAQVHAAPVTLDFSSAGAGGLRLAAASVSADDSQTGDDEAPLLVWQGGFGTGKDGWTIDVNGNTLAADGNAITLNAATDGSSKGVKLVKSGLSLTNATVLVRYSDYASTSRRRTLVAFNTASQVERWGLGLNADNKLNLFRGTDYDYYTGDACSMAESGTFGVTIVNNGDKCAYVPLAGGGTGVYSRSVENATDAITGFAIGGIVGSGSSGKIAQYDNLSATVTGIAVFNRVLTQAEIENYVWPSLEALDEMYRNRLSNGSEVIPAGKYGAITVPANGYKATAFVAATQLSNSASGDEVAGSYADIITKEGNDWDLREHTVAGWFKVDALPAVAGEANAKTIYVAKNGNDLYCGYKVAVDSEGKIHVGQCDNEAWRAAKVSTTAAHVEPGTWFHLAVAASGRTDGNRNSAVSIFVNGRAVAATDTKIKSNLNGGSAVLYVGGKGVTSGLGISAAGIYVDRAMLTNAMTVAYIAKHFAAEVPAVRPDITKDEATKTWIVDTTKCAYTFTADEIAELKATAWKVTLKSASEYGATVDFGTQSSAQASHFTVESGTHAMTWLNNTANINFSTTGTADNPSILVKSGATLNFTLKDLTGWQGAAQNKTGNLVRVNAGGTLNLMKSGSNTHYYQGRYWLDPGATVTATFGENKFRLNGGAVQGSEQFYVPASDTGSEAATLTVANGLRLAKDETAGLGVFVGENSKLVIHAAITSDGAQPLTKWGEGTLEIDGALTGFTGTLTANAGTLLLAAPTLGGTLAMAAGTMLSVAHDGEVAHGTVVLAAKSLTIADGVTLLVNGESWPYAVDGGNVVIEKAVAEVGGKKYSTIAEAVAAAGNGGTVKLLVPRESLADEIEAAAVELTPAGGDSYTVTYKMAAGAALVFSEIMPKPSDKPYEITTQSGYDKNGLESGWVEVVNTGDKWADLGDYKFLRSNRGKKYNQADYGNFPTNVFVAPGGRYTFYTSERYANSVTPAESAFATPVDAKKPHYFAEYAMMVWPDKVNPKKYPMVTLAYKPADAKKEVVVDTVVVPSDTPEGYSIIVGARNEDSYTQRWLCPSPTFNAANGDTTLLTELGPNVGPLYGVKHSEAEFKPTPPATPGVAYPVALNVNPVYNGTTNDVIVKVVLKYRTKLDKGVSGEVVMTADAANETAGVTYSAEIPADAIPSEAGQLIQWKTKITDAAGNVWTSPSFNNPDDGYEWYGTITEPGADLTAEHLATWHMFADDDSVAQMDTDVDKQTLPNKARVAIYDSSTSNYYDYVRIDLRGNTSAHFTKKSHGLRFSKAHPMTMYDPVRGKTWEEIRKTSLIGEHPDPSRLRQLTSFWLWSEMGNNVPFDFPVRCNLNGKFFQVGFNSERFTDELIEDVYGLDKYGYSYKNVGTLKPGSGTTAGSIEKKTPDDGNESDVSVLENELRKKISAAADVNEDNAALTKVVVERFDLPAWLNYLAAARITQEMDDVWANISAYYDSPQMLEGARGTATWMPLGYDFNLSLGQWYYGDAQSVGRPTIMSNQDWFKSHPFYGGMKVRCYKQAAMTDTCNTGNCGIESVLQSSKFRRLFLRRLRTLMDAYLGAPDADETFETTTNPIIVKMKEVAALMGRDGDLDRTTYPWDKSISANDVWGKDYFPTNITAGIEDIYANYIVPRRTHLYVTHSVTNAAKTVGYGTDFNAGIPEAQSPVKSLRDKITAEYDAAIGAVIIRNANAETIDLSGWTLTGPVAMTIPAGTVLDRADGATPGEVYVTADRRATVAAMELADQVVVGNGKAGKATAKIGLKAADGTKVVFEPSDVQNYLRLHSFDGVTNDGGEGDEGEWVCLTNVSDSVAFNLAGVRFTFEKQGDPISCDVTLAGVTLAPGAGITLDKATYWPSGRITSNKLYIYIYDGDGETAQYAKLTQKDFKHYYNKEDYYLAATAFGGTLVTGDFREVAYEPTVVPVVPGEGGATYETEEAAKKAAESAVVLRPENEVTNVIDAAGYAALFDVKAVQTATSTWELKPELKPSVSNAVQAAVNAAVDAQLVGTLMDEPTATVTTQAGLYYGMAAADALDKIETVAIPFARWVLGNGGLQELKADRPSEERGFYRIRVQIAPPAAE